MYDNPLPFERREAPSSIDTETTGSGLRFYGDDFVFDTVSGMFFRLSPTGSFILRTLASGAKPDTLAAAMAARYGIDRATATRDIELFLNDLSALEPLDRFAHDDQPAS